MTKLLTIPILNNNLPNIPPLTSILTACIPLLFILTAYYILIDKAQRHIQNSKLPKYNSIPSSTVQHIATKETLHSLKNHLDVAIIGSGIGALSNAVCLSRQGYKVAVFEQNETVGGCTHTFEKEGFEFDVGEHY